MHAYSTNFAQVFGGEAEPFVCVCVCVCVCVGGGGGGVLGRTQPGETNRLPTAAPDVFASP